MVKHPTLYRGNMPELRMKSSDSFASGIYVENPMSLDCDILHMMLMADSDDVVREQLQRALTGNFTRTEFGKMISFLNDMLEQTRSRQSAAQIMSSQVAATSRELEKTRNSADVTVTASGSSDIVVFGSINMDLVAQTQTFPQPNSTQIGAHFRTLPGGKGANEAWACGKLGSRCFMIGRVGDDDFGRIMLAKMSEYVNVDAVFTDVEEGTGVAMILNAVADKAKTNTPCAGANFNVGDAELEMLELYIQQHQHIRVIVFQLEVNHESVARGAQIAAAAGKVVILRGAPLNVGQMIAADLLSSTHILVVNEAEAAIALGLTAGQPNDAGLPFPLQTLKHAAVAARLLMRRSETLVAVVVLAGGVGVACHVHVGRATEKFPGLALVDGALAEELKAASTSGDDAAAPGVTLTLPHFREPVVDVIGAADAYTGGLAAGLAHGMPLNHSLVWAAACSAQSLRAAGAQESMPSMADLRVYLNARGVGVLGPSDGSEVWPQRRPSASLGGKLCHLEELLHDRSAAVFIEALKSAHLDREPLHLDTAVDFQGQTLLHIAINYQSLESVLALVEAGASLRVRDKYGMTPLDRCHEFFMMTRKAQKDRYALIKACLVVAEHVLEFLDNPTVARLSNNGVSDHGQLVRGRSQRSAVMQVVQGLTPKEALDIDRNGVVSRDDFDAADLDSDGIISVEEITVAKLRRARHLSETNSPDLEEVMTRDPMSGTCNVEEESMRRSLADAIMSEEGVRELDIDAIESPRQSIDATLDAKITLESAASAVASEERDIGMDGRDAPRGVETNGHNTSLLILGDCGTTYSYILKGTWATALLRLMLHFAHHGVHERHADMAVISTFSAWLLDRALSYDGAHHDLVMETIHATRLPDTNHSFLHGCAFAADEAVIEKLQTCMAAVPSRRASESSATGDGSDGHVNLTASEDFTRNAETDVDGRTALHYATLGKNASTCKVLLSWGQDMYQPDRLGKRPFDHCGEDREFSEVLEKHLLLQDTFVSVGHTPETDACIHVLVSESEKAKLKMWWDKGEKGAAQGIRPGEKWTSEIAKAMRGCKTVLIILTQKWLNSEFCEAEAKCALSYAKPIITLLPPVPKDQRVTVADISPSHPLYASMTQRQVFDFSAGTEVDFVRDLPKVFEAVRAAAPLLQGSHHDVSDLLEERVTDIIRPRSTQRYSLRNDMGKESFFFVVCGADIEDQKATAFARLLVSALRAEGITVALAYRQSETIKDDGYAVKLRKRVTECAMLICVLEDGHDRDFLSSVLQMASINKKQCIMAPYTKMRECREGFDYTAQLTTFKTWSFTDWMGAKGGLTHESPIFEQSFRGFVSMLDNAIGSINAAVYHEPRRCQSESAVGRMASNDFVTGTHLPHAFFPPVMEDDENGDVFAEGAAAPA